MTGPKPKLLESVIGDTTKVPVKTDIMTAQHLIPCVMELHPTRNVARVVPVPLYQSLKISSGTVVGS